MAVRIHVDRDLCEANAVCVRTAPDMFKVDDADKLHVLVDTLSGDEQMEKAKAAVRRCPRRALSLVE
jgi:ferredoxin